MNTLAIFIAMILGVLVVTLMVMLTLAVIGHYTDGTSTKWLRDLDEDNEDLVAIEPQEEGNTYS